jgi:methylmalonyl-CoA/ethylmalonyl-CoA epimerase
MLERLDHIGIAVRSIEEALPLFVDVLGAQFVLGGDDPYYGIRTIQLRLEPGVKLELMQPLRDDSYLHGYLDERGQGFHHLTAFVKDIEAFIEEVTANGYEVVDTKLDHPVWKVTYIRPSSGFGTLLQVAQTNTDWDHPVPGVTLERVLAGEIVWWDERPTPREQLPPGVTVDI